MLATIITAAAAFAATNIDDILINTLFFAKVRNRGDAVHIFVGKYLGIGTLTAASTLCALWLKTIPQTAIGLLGIVPIAYGAREWLIYSKYNGSKGGDDEKTVLNSSSRAVSALSVAAVTVANGADNLGVCISLFTAFTSAEMFLTVTVFAVMTAVWCVLSMQISRLPFLQDYIDRNRHIIPALFIFLGVYIIFKGFGVL